MLVYVGYTWFLKLYYLMLLLPLNIIVLLIEIIMTVEILYNLGVIEYSFIDISSIKTHQHIYVNIARVNAPFHVTTQWSELRH